MEKKRGNQAMGIAALFIAVIGLSLGFAAFSNTLTIKSTATVTPAATELDIEFTTATDGTIGTVTTQNATVLTPAVMEDQTEVTPAVTVVSGVTAPTINNSAQDGPEIGNLTAHFTAPNQSAEYVFYAHNAGHLVGYLKSVNFSGTEASCSRDETNVDQSTWATPGLVTAACDDMLITITVQNADGTTTIVPARHNGDGANEGSLTGISTNNSIAVGAYQKVTVKLEYASTTDFVDGPINVTYPNIQLVYSSTN